MAEIRVPPLGKSVTKVTVGPWRKKVGDAVTPHDALVELQTHKAAIDIESEALGFLTEIVALEGAVIPVGGLLGCMSVTAGASELAQSSFVSARERGPQKVNRE